MAHQRCDFPPDPRAEKLVADYLDAVIRTARSWQPSYPHDDIEHIFVGALYRAAWTWRSDGGLSFWKWWNRKARGALTPLNNKARRWSRGLAHQGRLAPGGVRWRGVPIRFVGYSAAQVDARYHYRA